MTPRACLAWGALIVAAWTGHASAQTTAPATRPAADFSTPAAALRTYLLARRALHYEDAYAALAIKQPAKKPYVEIVLHFLIARSALERLAVATYGPEAGTSILGRPRTFDDQTARDLDRLASAPVEISRAPDGTPSAARVLLKPEKDAPEGLQSDRFEFLDTYHFVKTADGWKLDFLTTTDSLAPDKEPQLQFEAGVFPTMAREFQALSDLLTRTPPPAAAALKADLQARWEKAYSAEPATRP